jgi:hypothetical protein
MVHTWLIALGLLVGAAPEPESYTIKLKQSAKGDVVKVEILDDSDTHGVATDPDGTKIQDNHGRSGEKMSYVETVLEKEGKATRLSRQYDKARTISQGDERTHSFEGKAIFIQKKSDKYQFQFESGDELTADDQRPLNEEFNIGQSAILEEEIEAAMSPPKPVKVGETWKIDADELLPGWNKIGVGTEGATATGKLLKVYEKAGHRYARFDILVEMPIKKFPLEGTKVAPTSKMKTVINVDACVDGTFIDSVMKTDMSMIVECKFPALDGGKSNIVLEYKTISTRKKTEQAKKR